jgi:hypothetical protein
MDGRSAQDDVDGLEVRHPSPRIEAGDVVVIETGDVSMSVEERRANADRLWELVINSPLNGVSNGSAEQPSERAGIDEEGARSDP